MNRTSAGAPPPVPANGAGRGARGLLNRQCPPMNILDDILSFIIDLFYVADHFSARRAILLACGVAILIAIIVLYCRS